ncbi:glycosyltransferase [Mycolicibacterium baixiangningiae]|uniref:glycosyltransferase n=1 Tax=Mycolicibacterium baixiangningiae TaxID=2761578 RepID=UPI001867B45E|nr:glycosyltransferase [Mycolicibacterium baixiangningiae]
MTVLSAVSSQRVSRTPSFGILSTYAPTPCGVAAFSGALCDGLNDLGAEVGVVRVADDTAATDPRVVGQVGDGSAQECAALLNQYDVAFVQYQYGIYGGVAGEHVLDILDGLHVPSIVLAHTIPKNPSPQERAVLESIVAKADRVVVISDAAHARLRSSYNVDHDKISTIPHGVTLPRGAGPKRAGRPTLLTWGQIGPGKGIERVIDAMPSLSDVPGRPQYLVVGQTDPNISPEEGEAYRQSCIDRAQRLGVADSVRFDDCYRSQTALTTMARSAAAVVLPYDSTEQAGSGVLAQAVASGRPVVATAFPHAVELLGTGAGIVVDHDDPAAMALALRRVLTEPRLAGALAGEGRRLAPTMAWPVVTASYLRLAQKVLAGRPAFV